MAYLCTRSVGRDRSKADGRRRSSPCQAVIEALRADCARSVVKRPFCPMVNVDHVELRCHVDGSVYSENYDQQSRTKNRLGRNRDCSSLLLYPIASHSLEYGWFNSPDWWPGCCPLARPRNVHCNNSVCAMEAQDRCVELTSKITCPACGHCEIETMPTNACQWFYDCRGCGIVLKPKAGDCCVYCSYGTVPCPPIQQGEACCNSE